MGMGMGTAAGGEVRRALTALPRFAAGIRGSAAVWTMGDGYVEWTQWIDVFGWTCAVQISVPTCVQTRVPTCVHSCGVRTLCGSDVDRIGQACKGRPQGTDQRQRCGPDPIGQACLIDMCAGMCG